MFPHLNLTDTFANRLLNLRSQQTHFGCVSLQMIEVEWSQRAQVTEKVRGVLSPDILLEGCGFYLQLSHH